MGDVDAIVAAAAKAGLTDEQQIRNVVKDSKYATKLKKTIKQAKTKLNIQKVPEFIISQDCGGKVKLNVTSGVEVIDNCTKVKHQCSRSSSSTKQKRQS